MGNLICIFLLNYHMEKIILYFFLLLQLQIHYLCLYHKIFLQILHAWKNVLWLFYFRFISYLTKSAVPEVNIHSWLRFTSYVVISSPFEKVFICVFEQDFEKFVINSAISKLFCMGFPFLCKFILLQYIN